MIQTRQTYEAPAAETLVVQTEGVICGSNNYGTPGQAGGDVIQGNSYDL